MSPRKKKTKKKAKKYLLELTLKSIIFWFSGLFFLLVWIFILGVLVGRGHLSYGIVKDKFAEVRDMASEKESSDSDLIKKSDEDPKFAFYEELSSKKEAAAKKSRPVVRKKSSRTISNKRSVETPKNSSSSIPKSAQQYVLQIGSFADRAKAVTMVDRLTDRGYATFFSRADIGGKRYYRVKCGPFKTEKKADEFKKVLAKREDVHGFVTRVDK
ncbi:MAG: SPOR domain-containing protein [Deltaproteobacteria bacterium]|nr:SPOR domain-containing protein [Deltaproteobacteria bacterium]